MPTAWRAAAGVPSVARVPLDALTGPLDALAGGAGTHRAVVLLAAHVKVLSMLAEEPGCHAETDLGGVRRRVPVGTAATWGDLVRRVSGHTVAADPAAGPPTEPGRVVLTDADDTVHPGYGLYVQVRDDGLLLRSPGEALTGAALTGLAGMYTEVLRAMANGPNGDARAACLPADQRRAVLRDWSTGPSADRGPVTVVDLIQRQAARTPDAVAVRSDGARLTYRELDEHSNRIARQLITMGAGPETMVGVALRRGADLLPALLGVWKSGAGYLPLDPALPSGRLRGMADASGCRLVVTDTANAAALGPGYAGAHLLLDADRARIGAQPAGPPGVPVGPASLAYVIYTSGSTGTPKGVMVEHGGLVNYLMWTAEAYAARGTGGSPFFSSISFDLGMPSLYTPLITGQAVHLLPDPLPTGDLGEMLAESGPYSFIKLTPGHLDLLSLDLTDEEIHGLAGIVIAAGDAFTNELATRWIKQAGPGGTVVATEYGPTEISIGNSGEPILEPPATDLIPLGPPIPNTTMYVLTDRLEPVPVGVPGEIYIGGVGVARGYLGRPALTAERFLPDPYGAPGSRLYRTGDRGRWRPDGALEFLGRVDHQVKIRGYRVELGEIQATLLRHPKVAEAVVIATGPLNRQTLAAFVVPAQGDEFNAAELVEHLAGLLPAYMIPASVVAVDRIPLTANGKVDTRAMAAAAPSR
ncbi:amino acid adenylation domain-containing protein [Actinoplanes sp. NPDC049802]|uniref:amino acid adenylation domain-containing protein n=1 Tax=Actinoplanes sp. NPDC049802 TaxID=3154742 RepID=UPI0033D4BA07